MISVLITQYVDLGMSCHEAWYAMNPSLVSRLSSHHFIIRLAYIIVEHRP